jgi:hypothetical protein
VEQNQRQNLYQNDQRIYFGTRLKNKLLLKIPELKPFHKGREVLLVFEKDVGPALVSACDYTDAMYLAKASEIVRREIFAEQNKFSGHVDSVPRCLVELYQLPLSCLCIQEKTYINSKRWFAVT